tara:strand:- start:534 stop:866 length:333 start_codon:yes stop_codon:yes gene_type:complete
VSRAIGSKGFNQLRKLFPGLRGKINDLTARPNPVLLPHGPGPQTINSHRNNLELMIGGMGDQSHLIEPVRPERQLAHHQKPLKMNIHQHAEQISAELIDHVNLNIQLVAR